MRPAHVLLTFAGTGSISSTSSTSRLFKSCGSPQLVSFHAAITSSLNQQFQRVSSYEQMILALYLAPEDTPVNAKPVLLKDIMRRLELEFPTFTIAKGTDMELGRRLSKMGYDSKRQNNGSAFRVVEKP